MISMSHRLNLLNQIFDEQFLFSYACTTVTLPIIKYWQLLLLYATNSKTEKFHVAKDECITYVHSYLCKYIHESLPAVAIYVAM